MTSKQEYQRKYYQANKERLDSRNMESTRKFRENNKPVYLPVQSMDKIQDMAGAGNNREFLINLIEGTYNSWTF